MKCSEIGKTSGKKIEYGPRAEKTIWGKHRKYMRRQNISGSHDESPHGGGRRGRPPQCGEGRTKAAPHHVAREHFQLASACIFSICAILHFLRLANIILHF